MSSWTTPVVSIVTVAHNAREGLLRGLAALQAGTEVPTEMIVVDNGSTDNTAKAVGYAFREVRLLRRDTPLHLPAALNLGAGQARAPWLLLLDPGLEPVGDAIRTLVEYAGGHPEHRLYTGRTLSAPPGPTPTDDGLTVEDTPSLWGTACLATGLPLAPERLAGRDRAIGGEVPALTPRMLLVERGLWESLGGFDESMPTADLSTRARALGARPVLVPDALMVALAPTPSRPPVTTSALAERMAFAHRHWPASHARAAGLLLATAALARSVAGDPWRTAWQARRAWLTPPPPRPAPATAPRSPAPSTALGSPAPSGSYTPSGSSGASAPSTASGSSVPTPAPNPFSAPVNSWVPNQVTRTPPSSTRRTHAQP